ncbi:hypothetical protein RBI14_15420 [Alcaligenaceae bacterium B3P038]|nr:hypothetical protein [Alcaligenaceae bacterium B3P038]
MAALLAPPTTAMLRMRLGTAAEEDRHTLAICINVGHIIASRVQRHNEHAPDMQRGAEAANDGWRNLDAVDLAVELFKGMARTTNRKTLLAAYTQAVAEAPPTPTESPQ